jgi:16S rRNA processing protein RimM
MIRIGKIVASHGLKGAVVFTHVAADAKWLKKGAPLFIEMQKGSYIPYFVSDLKVANEGEYIVNLEEVETVESAKRLVTKHVYVNEELLATYAKKSPLLWVGFQVTDVNTGIIGNIEDIMQTPGQWLAKIDHKGHEVLIPLIDQTIRDVNIKTRRLIVELPQGLLDVYM